MRKIVLLLALIWLTGCAANGVTLAPPAPERPKDPDKALRDAFAAAKQKKYAKAVAAFNKVIAEEPGSPMAADALYELALIHALNDNPQKDFTRATQAFHEFLRLHPDHTRALEARNWIVVIRMIQDLKKENERLNTSIEELKQLDIRHEEIRGK